MKLNLTLILTSIGALPHATTHCQSNLLYQYPKDSWLENLAVRQNGSILLTSLDFPGEIHSFNPFDGSLPACIATLPSLNSSLGIVETTPDNFYVLGSNFTLNGGTQPGSGTVFHLDFAGASPGESPTFKKVASLKGSQELNGITAFNETILLAADSIIGGVWAIDTRTGSSALVAQDPLMAPEGTLDGMKLGINGLHFKEGMLYFTNTQKHIFAKLEFDESTRPKGRATVVASAKVEEGTQTSWDDFTLDHRGNAFVATPGGNSVQLITPEGTVRDLSGSLNSTSLAQPTSAKFGRTWRDLDVLYVTTAGGLGEAVVQHHRPTLVGAQLVAVPLGRHCWW